MKQHEKKKNIHLLLSGPITAVAQILAPVFSMIQKMLEISENSENKKICFPSFFLSLQTLHLKSL